MSAELHLQNQLTYYSISQKVEFVFSTFIKYFILKRQIVGACESIYHQSKYRDVTQNRFSSPPPRFSCTRTWYTRDMKAAVPKQGSGPLCDRLYESIPEFFQDAQLLLLSNHDPTVKLHAHKEGARKY